MFPLLENSIHRSNVRTTPLYPPLFLNRLLSPQFALKMSLRMMMNGLQPYCKARRNICFFVKNTYICIIHQWYVLNERLVTANDGVDVFYWRYQCGLVMCLNHSLEFIPERLSTNPQTMASAHSQVVGSIMYFEDSFCVHTILNALLVVPHHATTFRVDEYTSVHPVNSICLIINASAIR